MLYADWVQGAWRRSCPLRACTAVSGEGRRLWISSLSERGREPSLSWHVGCRIRSLWRPAGLARSLCIFRRCVSTELFKHRPILSYLLFFVFKNIEQLFYYGFFTLIILFLFNLCYIFCFGDCCSTVVWKPPWAGVYKAPGRVELVFYKYIILKYGC